MDELLEKIHKIDKNVEVMLSKQHDLLETVKCHEKTIKEFQKLKHILYGMALIVSGFFGIVTAYLIEIFL